MAKTYYIYVLSNISKMIYIGVTNNLERRVFEHKSKRRDGFTKKYNLHRLVYYDETDDIGRAIEREKRLKGWTRQKKVALIESINPKWKDLSKDWYS
jgi:putative endonuclease